MVLNQMIRFLPRKQIHHQRPQPTSFAHAVVPEHRHRVVRCRDAVAVVRRLGHEIDDGVLAPFDLEFVRQDPEPDEAEIGRVFGGDFFVRQGAGVDPLDEVFEVDGARGGEMER